jgi:hypothetical protein
MLYKTLKITWGPAMKFKEHSRSFWLTFVSGLAIPLLCTHNILNVFIMLRKRFLLSLSPDKQQGVIVASKTLPAIIMIFLLNR